MMRDLFIKVYLMIGLLAVVAFLVSQFTWQVRLIHWLFN